MQLAQIVHDKAACQLRDLRESFRTQERAQIVHDVEHFGIFVVSQSQQHARGHRTGEGVFPIHVVGIRRCLVILATRQHDHLGLACGLGVLDRRLLS